MTRLLRNFSHRGVALYIATMAALTTATAAVVTHVAELPAEHQSEGIAYLTGGVDLDESTAIKAAMPRYPLVVEVYRQQGGKNEYTASASLTVSKPDGQALLNTTLEGPFALLRLDPGRYDVKVELEGKTLQRRVDVKQGASTRAPFVFKG